MIPLAGEVDGGQTASLCTSGRGQHDRAVLEECVLGGCGFLGAPQLQGILLTGQRISLNVNFFLLIFKRLVHFA